MSDDEQNPFDPASLGSLGDLVGNLMGQVQQVQSNIEQAKDQLRDKTVEGRAGGGIVTVAANGAGEVLRVTIDPVAVDPRDVPMLEDLVTAAVNDALVQAGDLRKAELTRATGGIPVPGMTDLL